MDRFIRRENVKHYRELLKVTQDESERQRILKLLAEEQQNKELPATPLIKNRGRLSWRTRSSTDHGITPATGVSRKKMPRQNSGAF
jgi:hypothetical protein